MSIGKRRILQLPVLKGVCGVIKVFAIKATHICEKGKSPNSAASIDYLTDYSFPTVNLSSQETICPGIDAI